MARTANKRIAKQARDWFIRLESATLGPKEQEHFADWLDKNPAHRAAYREIDEFSQSLVGVERLAALSSPPTAPQYTVWRRGVKRLQESLNGVIAVSTATPRMAFAWLGVALLAVSVLFAYVHWNPVSDGPATSYATRTAEIRHVKLADGSVVSLGARTRLTVQYDNRQRKVTFTDGEAYFDVARNPEQPFVVQAGDVQVRVLGTQFNVSANAGWLDVAVAEGKVRLIQPSESVIPLWGRLRPQKITIEAGEQVRASAGKFEQVISANTGEIGSWRQGKLVYHRVRLGEVIADVRRYTEQNIVFADPQLAELRLSAVLGVEQINNMLMALSLLLPVEIDQSMPGTIFVKPQQTQNNK